MHQRPAARLFGVVRDVHGVHGSGGESVVVEVVHAAERQRDGEKDAQRAPHPPVPASGFQRVEEDNPAQEPIGQATGVGGIRGGVGRRGVRHVSVCPQQKDHDEEPRPVVEDAALFQAPVRDDFGEVHPCRLMQ